MILEASAAQKSISRNQQHSFFAEAVGITFIIVVSTTFSIFSRTLCAASNCGFSHVTGSQVEKDSWRFAKVAIKRSTFEHFFAILVRYIRGLWRILHQREASPICINFHGHVLHASVTTGWIEYTLLESQWWFLSSNSGTCEKSC